MFDFLFQKKNGELQSLLDIVTVNMTRIQLSKLAMEKAKYMIAKAIAKSEIIIQGENGRRYDEYYFRLNVRPNDNQTGTDFWMDVVYRLLTYGECVICVLQGKYYICTNYTVDNRVLYGKTYSSVEVTDGRDTIRLMRDISVDDVIHLRYDNQKITRFAENVLGMFNDALSALNKMETLSNTPFFKFKMNAQHSFRTKNADGTERVLTIDEYLNKIREKLENDNISIFPEGEGTELQFFGVSSKVTAEEIVKMSKQINTQCAISYDIPEAVFSGNITEKSDATNEFITFAVSPVAEVINDSLNAKLVGIKDYVEKQERIMVWLARYKHIDVVDSAASLDKLRGIGFNFDEILEMVGYAPLRTEFSQKRALTKNYSTEEQGGDTAAI